MASQYAPERLPIVDPGNVAEIWVDGLAYYFEVGGVTHAGFYRLMPKLDGGAMARPERLEPTLCFRFGCTVDVHRRMRRAVFVVTEPVRPELFEPVTAMSC